MSDTETVVIVGGNFANKGAELMVSVALEVVRSSGDNITPIVVNSFPSSKEKSEYNGALVLNIPFYLNFSYCMVNGINSSAELLLRTARLIFSGCVSGRLFKEIRDGVLGLKAIANARYIVDISGYGYNSNSGLMNYIQLGFSHLASTKLVPYVYFPQSFGPFDRGERLLNLQFKTAIESAANVFCRESMSISALANITDRYSGGYWPDIALLYGKEACAAKNPENIDMGLIGGSVVLIPNSRLYDNFSEARTNDLYHTLISYMLNIGYRVTILKHSSDDIGAVESIKHAFPSGVCVLEKDYGLSTIDDVIASALLVISGRYHGLVVSLKNKVPCMAIGWAHKYDELLGIYNMMDYNFDLSKPLDKDEIYSQLEGVLSSRSSLSDDIKRINLNLSRKYPLSEFISLFDPDYDQ